MTTRKRPQTPLGKQITELRKGTQEELATLAGLSIDGLKAVEQGRRADPRLSTVVKIAAALGVTVDELIRGTGLPTEG